MGVLACSVRSARRCGVATLLLSDGVKFEGEPPEAGYPSIPPPPEVESWPGGVGGSATIPPTEDPLPPRVEGARLVSAMSVATFATESGCISFPLELALAAMLVAPRFLLPSGAPPRGVTALLLAAELSAPLPFLPSFPLAAPFLFRFVDDPSPVVFGFREARFSVAK